MKEFLSQKGIAYTEKDVIADQAALTELEEIGVLTTPVTVIDGQVIVGFDRKKLEEALSR